MQDSVNSVAKDIAALFGQAQQALAGSEPHAALRYAQQAWSLAPQNADLSNLVGVCALGLNDFDSAQQFWRHAIALSPSCYEAHFNLALFLAERGEAAEAERHLRAVTAIQPGHTGAHARLGALLAAQKRVEEAEKSYRQAIALAPQETSAPNNLGVLLAAAGRTDEAEQCYSRALELDAGNAEAHANLGLLYESQGRLQEAERTQWIALTLNPRSARIHSNLANLLGRMLRTEEAETLYRRAIELDPQSAVAHSNLGVALAYSGQEDEAEHMLRRALELAPGYQRARLNLAMLLLSQGRLAEGWVLHEARHHPDLPDPDAPLPPLPCPQWQGEPLIGKALLVWPEQGYGDMIQFCRYLPLLKRQGAARITLVCRPALAGLMQTLEGVDAVFALGDKGALEAEHDFWTLPMSLPLHCGTELDTIPASVPYLRAPAARRTRWAERLPAGRPPGRLHKLHVGLVWQGNARHANDAHRSLPGLDALAPLWAATGVAANVQFFGLQYGENAASAVEYGFDMIDLGQDIADFADTAAIIEQLDLLITVDTASAHVAGALGTPCWVLLPAYRTDWRWLRNRDDSPWYPHMRLFRQARGQDWRGLIEQVALAISRHVAGRRQ